MKKKSEMEEALHEYATAAADTVRRKTTQQADATRSPSGKTQKLAADADRKFDVLVGEGRIRNKAPIQTRGQLASTASNGAWWTIHTGKPGTTETQRAINIEKVAGSLQDTREELAASRKADDRRRNK